MQYSRCRAKKAEAKAKVEEVWNFWVWVLSISVVGCNAIKLAAPEMGPVAILLLTTGDNY